MALTALDGLAIALIIVFLVRMAETPVQRKRASSHKEYLDTLQRPTADEIRRIAEIQRQKEQTINAKYHTAEEHEAATIIQKAYRGHRERRQLEGLTLDPSSRWVEAIKEWRYRSVTTPQYGQVSTSGERRPSPADVARSNWRRVGQIAEHAAGDLSPSASPGLKGQDSKGVDSMFLDLRYFLEMIDTKHRYGANLQIYHEEWQRSETKQPFFVWLDHGEGKNVSLPYCDRARLDRERIRYLSRDERKDYLVRVDEQGKLRWNKNDELITTSGELYRDSVHGIVSKDSDDHTFDCDTIDDILPLDQNQGPEDIEESLATAGHHQFPDADHLDQDRDLAHQAVTKDKTPKKHFHVSPATILNHLLRASVKPGTWIYVADTVGRLYVGIKNSGNFQHTSFLAGARIRSAGSIGIKDGRLVYLSPLSGHYRPTTKSFRAFINSLKEQGVDLSHLKVSHAYRVLLGMEYYSKTKTLFHHKGEKETKRPTRLDQHHGTTHEAVDVGVVEQPTHEEHKRGLAKLMDDLHIRRLSSEQQHSRT